MKPKSFRSPRWILFAVLILVFASINAGPSNALAGGEEWRPVDAADIALKTPVVEPTADAEAIFWDIRIDDGGQYDLVLNHYVRIKIFTERGRDEHSKIDIPYIAGTKIKDVAARTIKPDGTIVELAKEDIIEKVVVKVSGLKLTTKTFAFPGIEPGAIIEYKWKEVVSNTSANNMRLQFQRDIPVQSITYRIKPARDVFFDVRPFNMPKFEFQKEKGGFQTTTVKNMRAFHEEPMMPPEDSVRAWAMVRYSGLASLSYYLLAGTIYYGLDSWLKVDDQIKKKAAEITAGATTPEEKLEKIFEFCRTNIKNTHDVNAGFSEDQIEKLKENKKPSDTLKRGVGPGIDINLLFAALAKAAGFDTRIALLPDRGKRLFNKNEVVPGSLKPSNIAVKMGERWQFFDPGLPYVAKGMLRWQEEGVDALLVAESPIWVKTPLSSAEKSKEKHVAELKLDENGTLEGDVTVEFTGHLAVERKVFNEDDSPEQREENLKESIKSRLSSAELTNIVIENATDSSKPFVYKYHVRVPEYAQRTGKRLFFQPGYFQKGISALFSAGTRSYPIYFHYPWSEEDRITISLPKGYALDNADRPTPIVAGEVSEHEIKIAVTKDESKLIFDRRFFFGGNNSIVFAVQTYEPLKQLFDKVHKADNHMITLKQVTASN
ncbi:MAG TPA: DUF3857 domain-containing protein [Pyrinomonadaceae bacterium]|nr:DUF3857 domain-containing protein [Pyrinomonadaceae bacterium]